MVSPSENVPISIEREGEDAIVIRWNDGGGQQLDSVRVAPRVSMCHLS